MPRSDPVLQACYAIFRVSEVPAAQRAEAIAEAAAFARAHRPEELGLCPSCWSIFRYGTRHGECSGDCVLAQGKARIPVLHECRS